jgi:hypothetical protein
MTTDNAEDTNHPTTSESLKAREKEMEAMEADIAKLGLLLSQESDNSEAETDVSRLLERLENANGMAQGVEDKIDGLLEKLDGLLVSLETKGELAEKTSKEEANESAQ